MCTVKINCSSLAKCKNVESLHSCDASDYMRANHQGRFFLRLHSLRILLRMFTNSC